MENAARCNLTILTNVLGIGHSAHVEDYRQFLRRRMREEVQRAETEETERLRRLHWAWAGLYRARLKSLDESDLSIAA